eukprot:TRINITY_DN4257_c0_g2_i2.p1 TRINITY_DN4257_c0_g2~~TRINITY_DN4257_c0_g2_i2.p1  ORF type:complete len:655 (-),score=68.64 TRINITY_DN4257_c0_g2_i2:2520-4343(-)
MTRQVVVPQPVARVVRPFGTSTNKVQEWTTEYVLDWARDTVKLSETNLKRLKANEITGETLLDQSKEDFLKIKIPLGPATKLVKAIETLKTSPSTALLLDAIKNATILPIPWNKPGPDPEVKVVTLDGLMWLALESSHLFVRKPYERLWDYIEESYYDRLKPDSERQFRNERVLIRGNSGIGKTASLNYFLIRALQKGIPVLFETRNARYFFHGSIVERESIVLNDRMLARYRDDRDVLILHDHLPSNEPPLVVSGGFVVAPVSPDPKNFHEFGKHNALSLWMPLPTVSELAVMNSIVPKLSETELQQRIATYGTIPRSVFANDQQSCLDKLTGKIMSFELGRNFLHMLSNAELPENKHGLSWWIVHVDATEDLRRVSTIRWASDEIFDRVISCKERDDLSELEEFLASALRSPPLYRTLPTIEYQRWAAFKIATGIPLQFYHFDDKPQRKTMKSGEDRDVVVPSNEVPEEYCLLSKVMPTSTMYDLQIFKQLSENRNTLFYSTRSNEPLCDAMVMTKDTLYLFNMTLGETHDIKKSTFTDYVKAVKHLNKEPDVTSKITKVRLVFVVPHRKSFSLPKSVLDMAPQAPGLDIALVVSELQLQTFCNK